MEALYIYSYFYNWVEIFKEKNKTLLWLLTLINFLDFEIVPEGKRWYSKYFTSRTSEHQHLDGSWRREGSQRPLPGTNSVIAGSQRSAEKLGGRGQHRGDLGTAAIQWLSSTGAYYWIQALPKDPYQQSPTPVTPTLPHTRTHSLPAHFPKLFYLPQQFIHHFLWTPCIFTSSWSALCLECLSSPYLATFFESLKTKVKYHLLCKILLHFPRQNYLLSHHHSMHFTHTFSPEIGLYWF